MARPDGAAAPPPAPSRRALLGGGLAAAVAGAAVGAGAVRAAGALDAGAGDTPPEQGWGPDVVPFHGVHQAGVQTPAQAHARFVALDLRAGTDREGVQRLLRLITDDAARLTSARPPLAADDVELAARPARLTVTVGFGAGLFDAIGRPQECPEVIRSLPAFDTDRLSARFSGGDLLLQVCADDPLALSYAVRKLVRDSRAVADVRWVQTGFNPARGAEPSGTTPRNLMGQRDGSANPALDSDEFAAAVWIDEGPPWLRGGSMLVLRRIRMDLETWDDLGREAKELAIGRRLDTGAPLTGGTERDRPDASAVDAQGFPVLADEAHVLRATHRSAGERMLRRGFSYDDGPDEFGKPDAGLIFAAYQADAATAFVPVMRRLAAQDALNLWTTHVGSAAFVVPAGVAPGQFLGQPLVG